MRVALLGDSILDNGAYVGGGRDVTAYVRDLLPSDASVDLLARDGSRIEQVELQVARIPPDTTHVIVSAGGNDAIDVLGLLDTPVTNVAEALRAASDLYGTFRYRYRGLLARLRSPDYAVSVCTIYEPRFTEGDILASALSGLALFNDAIVREATMALTPVLDLRRVCTDSGDFANPIEPSDAGGHKIAAAIARYVTSAVPSTNAISLYW
jgi:hypothetical protein